MRNVIALYDEIFINLQNTQLILTIQKNMDKCVVLFQKTLKKLKKNVKNEKTFAVKRQFTGIYNQGLIDLIKFKYINSKPKF